MLPWELLGNERLSQKKKYKKNTHLITHHSPTPPPHYYPDQLPPRSPLFLSLPRAFPPLLVHCGIITHTLSLKMSPASTLALGTPAPLFRFGGLQLEQTFPFTLGGEPSAEILSSWHKTVTSYPLRGPGNRTRTRTYWGLKNNNQRTELLGIVAVSGTSICYLISTDQVAGVRARARARTHRDHLLPTWYSARRC